MTNSEIVLKYRKGEVSEDTLAKVFYPIIKRVCDRVSSKVGQSADDLAQDVWFLFTSKIVHEYDISRGIDSYIYAYAHRHGMHLKGEKRESCFSDFESANHEGEDEVTIEDWLNSIGATEESYCIDEEQILSLRKREGLKNNSLLDLKLLSRIPGVDTELARIDGDEHSLGLILAKVGLLNANDPDGSIMMIQGLNSLRAKPKIEEVEQKKIRDVSSDSMEIRGIRLAMGKTRLKFSQELGITKGLLSAYEYGRTKSIPSMVMENARMMLRNFTDDLSSVRDEFNSKKMSEIVHDWAGRLQIPVSEMDSLAVVLRTTRTTVRRWLLDQSKANIEKIADLDQIVTDISMDKAKVDISMDKAKVDA